MTRGQQVVCGIFLILGSPILFPLCLVVAALVAAFMYAVFVVGFLVGKVKAAKS
jgi:hypothetical protein